MDKKEIPEPCIKSCLLEALEEVIKEDDKRAELVKNLRARVRILEEQIAMLIEEIGNE